VHIAPTIACPFAIAIHGHAEEPKSIGHYVTRGTPVMNIAAAGRVLRADDVQWWAQLLSASESQLQFMMAEYGDFVRRHNEFMDREMPPYIARSQELALQARTEDAETSEFAGLALAFDRESARLRQQMTSLETSLIDSFALILTPEQSDRLSILRHESVRRHCRSFYSLIRWNDVELRPIWIRSAIDLSTPSERENVEAILADYETQLTNLICAQANLDAQTRHRLRLNRIARQQGAITPHAARSRYDRIIGMKIEAAQAVQRLHENIIRRISEAVGDEVAEAFAAAAREAAFPELYPDRTARHRDFESAQNDITLTEDARDLIEHLYETYAARYRQLSDELEETCMKWAIEGERGTRGFEPQQLGDALKPLLEKRSALSQESFEALQALLKH
jgi:hypothetical protein